MHFKNQWLNHTKCSLETIKQHLCIKIYFPDVKELRLVPQSTTTN